MRERLFTAAAAACLAAALALLTSPAAQAATAPSAQTLEVVSATLEALPETYDGPCPVTIKFPGRITVKGKGTVKYTFVRSDGATAPVYTLDFAGEETKSVETTWTLSPPSYAGWQAIKVLSPNELESNRAPFKLTCRKGAAQSFRVTGAWLKADRAKNTGRCPLTVNFGGGITADGPGVVKYTFGRSDGARAPVYTLEFDAAGTKPVHTTWTLGGPGLPSYKGWQTIKVLSPNELSSPKAEGAFEVACNGSGGVAPPDDEGFQVTSVALKAERPSYRSEQCPVTVVFKGHITTNGPGSVRYHIKRSDGAVGEERTLDFREAGTQEFSTTWTLGGPDLPYARGFVDAVILSPRSASQPHSYRGPGTAGEFEITCGKGSTSGQPGNRTDEDRRKQRPSEQEVPPE